jgi:hypothetical protein
VSLDRETLLQMLTDDEFGLLKPPPKRVAVTPDDRLLAGFQEIEDFVRANDREPERNPADMTEARLAMRLKAIRENAYQAAGLRGADDLGLLGDAPPEPEPIVIPESPPESLEHALQADPFGLLDGAAGIFDLKHVPATPTMPDRVAQRTPAADFDRFEHLFTDCHADIRAGRRKLLEFKNPSEIEQGKFFVLNGVLLYVAEIGEQEFAKSNKGNNARTRCIFENGTESDLLVLSLGRNLYKDGRRVTEPNEVTLARMGLDSDTKMGHIYVLRSLSEDPQLAAFGDAHKIGFTTQTVEERLAGAEADATFLGAPVEIVASYALPAVAARQVEAILHAIFTSARLDIWFEQNSNAIEEAREWFDVPLPVIDEAIELINTEAIGSYEYDSADRQLRLAGASSE